MGIILCRWNGTLRLRGTIRRVCLFRFMRIRWTRGRLMGPQFMSWREMPRMWRRRNWRNGMTGTIRWPAPISLRLMTKSPGASGSRSARDAAPNQSFGERACGWDGADRRADRSPTAAAGRVFCAESGRYPIGSDRNRVFLVASGPGEPDDPGLAVANGRGHPKRFGNLALRRCRAAHIGATMNGRRPPGQF